jgi:hypothetical protein
MKFSRIYAIAAGFAFGAAFAAGISGDCAQELISQSKKDGFDTQEFIKDLVPAVAKVKAQAKMPLQFLFGPGPNDKKTNIGITVGCLKSFPESPDEIKSSLKSIGLGIGDEMLIKASNLAANKLGQAGDEIPIASKPSRISISPLSCTASSNALSCSNGTTIETVQIGEQVWMAENLNYAAGNNACYGDKESNCQKCGRLYDWSTATMICPSGWHLPTNAEWEALERGGNSAKEALSVLKCGHRYTSGSFFGYDSIADFWSATESSSGGAAGRNFKAGFVRHKYDKVDLLSVRCVMD